MTATSRLPSDYKKALSRKTATIYGFDRITLFLNNPNPSLPIEKIDTFGGKIEVIPRHDNPYWRSEIRLFQPSSQAIKLLLDAVVERRYRVQIRYVEIACDSICRSRDDAKNIACFFLAHLVIKGWRSPVFCERKTTYYYERRSSSGKKSPHVFVIYADQPSKLSRELNAYPCCHLEHRFFGSEKIRALGLCSLEDILNFNHRDFWSKRLILVRRPKKLEIGRLFSTLKRKVSGTSYTKKANALFLRSEVNGVFVMQNFKLNNPEVFRTHIDTMDHLIWLD